MITPTSTGPNPFARSEPGTKFPGANTVSNASTSANPPMTSDTKLAQGCRMAGDREKTARWLSGFVGPVQCGSESKLTITTPVKPPAPRAGNDIRNFALANVQTQTRAMRTG